MKKLVGIMEAEASGKKGYMAQVFGALDRDGSGTLSLDEVKTFLNRVLYDHPEYRNRVDEVAQEFMRTFDVDGNKSVDINEFLDLCKLRENALMSPRVAGMPAEVKAVLVELKRMTGDGNLYNIYVYFRMIDRNFDNHISLSEISEFLEQMGRMTNNDVFWKPNLAQALFRALDADNSGSVTTEEFISSITSVQMPHEARGRFVRELTPVTTAFHKALAEGRRQDYAVLMDCSAGMMRNEVYNMARYVLTYTIPNVFTLDRDGIEAWVMRGPEACGTGNITSGEYLDHVLEDHYPDTEYPPRFSSSLDNVLSEHFNNPSKRNNPLAVLVVVSTEPYDRIDVARVLVRASYKDVHKNVTVSFLNVNTDSEDFTPRLAMKVNNEVHRHNFVDSCHLPWSPLLDEPNDVHLRTYFQDCFGSSLRRPPLLISPSPVFFDAVNMRRSQRRR